jgi:hypothetical protein
VRCIHLPFGNTERLTKVCQIDTGSGQVRQRYLSSTEAPFDEIGICSLQGHLRLQLLGCFQ